MIPTTLCSVIFSLYKTAPKRVDIMVKLPLANVNKITGDISFVKAVADRFIRKIAIPKAMPQTVRALKLRLSKLIFCSLFLVNKQTMAPKAEVTINERNVKTVISPSGT